MVLGKRFWVALLLLLTLSMVATLPAPALAQSSSSGEENSKAVQFVKGLAQTLGRIVLYFPLITMMLGFIMVAVAHIIGSLRVRQFIDSLAFGMVVCGVILLIGIFFIKTIIPAIVGWINPNLQKQVEQLLNIIGLSS